MAPSQRIRASLTKSIRKLASSRRVTGLRTSGACLGWTEALCRMGRHRTDAAIVIRPQAGLSYPLLHWLMALPPLGQGARRAIAAISGAVCHRPSGVRHLTANMLVCTGQVNLALAGRRRPRRLLGTEQPSPGIGIWDPAGWAVVRTALIPQPASPKSWGSPRIAFLDSCLMWGGESDQRSFRWPGCLTCIRSPEPRTRSRIGCSSQ